MRTQIISCSTFAENEYFFFCKKQAQLHETKTEMVNHPERIVSFLLSD